jgi:phosphoribosylformimino-5-aminoimidazole carboxamide ribotide isomerase
MEIIPVIDLSGGVAVHARAGDRATYQPVRSVLLPDGAGDPIALIRAFREQLGAGSCYLADLDAIAGGAVQSAAIRHMAEPEGAAGPLLVDAGTDSPDRALELLSYGASVVVVGLETLRDFAGLVEVIDAVGTSRVVFSLDLRMGGPLVHSRFEPRDGPMTDALSLAAQAIEAGATCLLVLDLGRVGTGRGLDLELLEKLRRRFPHVRLLAGGGVGNPRDLERMRDAGCDGALVASALHDGTVTADTFGMFAAEMREAGDRESGASRRETPEAVNRIGESRQSDARFSR